MGNVSTLLHMFMGLVWFLCFATASHDHLETGTCTQDSHSGNRGETMRSIATIRVLIIFCKSLESEAKIQLSFS